MHDFAEALVLFVLGLSGAESKHEVAGEGGAAPVSRLGARPREPCSAPLSPVTFAVHAHLQALEQPAVLAAVALLAGHDAVLVAAASVHALVADAPLEEALAALAGDDAIVQPRGPVPADQAGPLIHPLICKARGKAYRGILGSVSALTEGQPLPAREDPSRSTAGAAPSSPSPLPGTTRGALPSSLH